MRTFHSYQGGFCAHCGADLGYIEVDGGRTRRYCGDACRKAASRERSKRDLAVSRNEALVGLWNENGLTGECRRKLETILARYGKDAAVLATDVVIASMKEVDGRYQSLYSYKNVVDEFERLKQSHFDLMYKHSQLRTEKERLERRLARLEKGQGSAEKV